jgi:hypothetical protein
VYKLSVNRIKSVGLVNNNTWKLGRGRDTFAFIITDLLGYSQSIAPLEIVTLKLWTAKDRLCGLVVSVAEVPGSIPGHSLGFF